MFDFFLYFKLKMKLFIPHRIVYITHTLQKCMNKNFGVIFKKNNNCNR